MRVDETVRGKVKVTLSFEDWKDRDVKPATFELRIADPEAASEAAEAVEEP